ncbi:MAG: hypothetical protein E7045_03910 [Lentisphaerae bacterium]|nr:hypothetical protein [Lentisphaerota bacterium]
MTKSSPAGRLQSSFRDPSGFVYRKDGKVFRHICKNAMADFERFISSGLAGVLVDRELLLPFEIISKDNDSITVEPEQIPFVTWCYEWSYNQFLDAAAVTAEICRTALEYGFILKDASAFNLTYHKGRMYFIDHTSFVPYDLGTPWMAYKQFCMQFFSPLMLMKYVTPETIALLKSDVDGIKLDVASKMLPWKSYFFLPALTHIHLHALADKKYSGNMSESRSVRMKADGLHDLLETILHDLKSLGPGSTKTLWQDYYSCDHYSKASFEHKKLLTEEFCSKRKPGVLLDAGANSGVFSQIASRYSTMVVAADFDANAVDALYLKCRNTNSNIFPVKLDIFNPTPAVGAFNEERSSFFDRCQPDCIMGLALMHHLRVTGNWNLDNIVKFFAMAKKSALVEFVPLDDPRMQQLVRGRGSIYADWELENVVTAFKRSFSKVRICEIINSSRVLIELDK